MDGGDFRSSGNRQEDTAATCDPDNSCTSHLHHTNGAHRSGNTSRNCLGDSGETRRCVPIEEEGYQKGGRGGGGRGRLLLRSPQDREEEGPLHHNHAVMCGRLPSPPTSASIKKIPVPFFPAGTKGHRKGPEGPRIVPTQSEERKYPSHGPKECAVNENPPLLRALGCQGITTISRLWIGPRIRRETAACGGCAPALTPLDHSIDLDLERKGETFDEDMVEDREDVWSVLITDECGIGGKGFEVEGPGGMHTDVRVALQATGIAWDQIASMQSGINEIPHRGLHVRKVPFLAMEEVMRLPSPRKAVAHLKETWTWLDNYLRQSDNQSMERQRSSFNFNDMEHTLMDDHKYSRWEGERVGTVKGFPVEELKNEDGEVYARCRPVFACSLNMTWMEKGLVVFAPKKEIRRISAQYTYHIALDFVSFYDQLEMPESWRRHFTFIKEGVWYALIRAPMGLRQIVALAVAVTWTLMDIPIRIKVERISWIDNVRFSGDSVDEVTEAAMIFLARCKKVSASVKIDNWKGDDYTEEAIRAHVLATRKMEFLGETYDFDEKTRSHTTKTKTKLKTIQEFLLRNRQQPITYRQLASIVGVLCYSAEVVDVPLYEAFHALRKYRRVMSHLVCPGASWDAPEVTLSEAEQGELESIIKTVILAPPTRTVACTRKIGVLVTDASHIGWGGVFIPMHGKIRVAAGKWEDETSNLTTDADYGKSTVAEPLAVLRALKEFKKGFAGEEGIVDVLVDHQPLIYTRAPKSYYTNLLRNALAKNFKGISFNFKFVPGEENPSDGISRGKSWSDQDMVKITDLLNQLENDDGEEEEELPEFVC